MSHFVPPGLLHPPEGAESAALNVSVPAPTFSIVIVAVSRVPCSTEKTKPDAGRTSATGSVPPPATLMLTGTSTIGVAGSLLLTHDSPGYVPRARPLASNVTVTSRASAGTSVPLAGLTLAHGRSLTSAHVAGDGLPSSMDHDDVVRIQRAGGGIIAGSSMLQSAALMNDRCVSGDAFAPGYHCVDAPAHVVFDDHVVRHRIGEHRRHRDRRRQRAADRSVAAAAADQRQRGGRNGVVRRRVRNRVHVARRGDGRTAFHRDRDARDADRARAAVLRRIEAPQ
ncbi:MAG TPA: hypothetical protein VGC30_09270 [Dokdonella sp.]